jgi:hypothetical protein
MIEYAIIAFMDSSFSLNSQHSVLLPYFLFGAIVMTVIGYWIKKKMGAFIALLSVLFAYLYFAGSFNRIIW